MLSFRNVGGKAYRNTRLSHVEDLMFHEGRDGLAASLRILRGLAEHSPDLSMTLKWDGSPAVVCGINPDNGKFFVATKGAFNKVVKAYHTCEEIRRGVDNPDLAAKLEECLIHLSDIGIRGVLQGDLLFTASDLTVTESEVSFMPNAIRYSIDRRTATARAIQGAKIGIAFHTVYEGGSMAELTAVNFNFDPSSLDLDGSVWMPSIAVKNLVEGDNEPVRADLTECEAAAAKVTPFLKTLLSNTELVPYIMPYVNSTVMANLSDLSPSGLSKYVGTKIANEAAKLKTDKGKEGKAALADRLINFMEVYANQLKGAFDLHKRLMSVKETLLSRASDLTEFRHSFVDEGGIRPTTPEGIVVDDGDIVVKLVHRSEFSAHNRRVHDPSVLLPRSR
jgi:hypothetical protein